MSSPSPRLLRALTPFGLMPGALASVRAADERATESAVCALVEQIENRLKERSPAGRGVVALLTGPSGSGKSSLLGALAERVPVVCAHRARLDPALAPAEHRASLPLDLWLGVLSRAGLADARLLATPAGRLSDGERARLRLALAMASVTPRTGSPPEKWLLVDECCSTLDRDTAAGVAATLRRWADRTGCVAVAASAHADLEPMLGPDVVARCRVLGPVAIGPGTGRVRGAAIRVGPGSNEDYAHLAAHHYRPGRPASPAKILRATIGGRLAGVLVVTHPTLNGSWREMIWPGRYSGTDKRTTARRLNSELRRIGRVIVDPRDRGRGVARRLVRAYLDDPETPATEAVAAMGRLSPFGRSAGMVEYPMPPRPADDRLADVLASRGVEPWMLLDGARAVVVLEDGFVSSELERWGRSVRSSIPKPMRGDATARTLAPLAAGRLCAPPVAYGHTRS